MGMLAELFVHCHDGMLLSCRLRHVSLAAVLWQLCWIRPHLSMLLPSEAILHKWTTCSSAKQTPWPALLLETILLS